MSDNNVLRGEISLLDGRVRRVETLAADNSRRSQDAEQKLKSLNSSIDELTGELRVFTSQISRLAILTESRNNIFILGERLAREYGEVAGARTAASRLIRAMGDASVWGRWKENSITALAQAAPRYWLASAALAVASWLSDDKAQAERRVLDAVTLDDAESSLYFCLVSRRFGRHAAMAEWLRRYFAAQNPAALDSNASSLVRAAWDGRLGGDDRQISLQAAENWAAGEMAGNPPDKETVGRWENFLLSLDAGVELPAFPHIKEHSPSWPAVEASLSWLRVQYGMAALFRADAENPVAVADAPPVQGMEFSLQTILDGLTGEYLDGERPLRREYRLSSLIVEENGDTEAACARLEQEWPARSERRPFSDLLLDVAMGRAAASPGMRRLGVMLSQPWIDAAYAELNESERARPPERIEVKIGGWAGTTATGKDESDLLASFSRHHEEADRDQSPVQWLDQRLVLPAILLVLISLITVDTVIVPLLALGGFAYYFFTRMKAAEVENAENAIRREESRKEKMTALSAFLGEVAAYRQLCAKAKRELTEARAKLDAANSTRGAIAPDISAHPERREDIPILGEGVPTLPAWSLTPPFLEVANKSQSQ